MKAQIIAALEQAREDELALLDSLTEVERRADGTFEDWSAKDVLAHITGWRSIFLEGLKARMRGETPPPGEDPDRVNERMYREKSGQSLETIQAEAESVHQELMKQVRSLPEEELVDPDRFEWREGRPLWPALVGNAFTHPLFHMALFLLDRGQPVQALKVQERATETLLSLSQDPGWRGIARYNLACFHALNGQKERAISQLGQALKLNPDLSDWSREDPDLLSLHEEPAYQALYDSM